MGCDIHAYIEYQNPKSDRTSWNNFGGRINPGRNYRIFERLAGVRGDGPPVVAPRGIPEQLGWRASEDFWMWIDYDGHGSGDGNDCTPEEAEYYHKSGRRYRGTVSATDARPRWVEAPDWHTPSWVTPNEWEAALTSEYGQPTEYKAMLAAMRVLEQDGFEARVVFWFDN